MTGAKLEDAGRILADTLKQYMSDLGICDGLKTFGYGMEHIPNLVKGTLPLVLCDPLCSAIHCTFITCSDNIFALMLFVLTP